MDDYELIDVRRFLLSAALPWPFPSLTELLVVLQRFKAADTGDTGYINEEQYQKVSLYTHTNSGVHCKVQILILWSDIVTVF